MHMQGWSSQHPGLTGNLTDSNAIANLHNTCVMYEVGVVFPLWIICAWVIPFIMIYLF